MLRSACTGLAFLLLFAGVAPGGSPTTASPVSASVPSDPYVLTVVRPTGGTVRSAGIDCGTTGAACQVTMPGPVVMGLLVTPDPGFAFAGWTGDCTGTAASFALALSGPRTCGAVFTQVGSRPSTWPSPVTTPSTPMPVARAAALDATQYNAVMTSGSLAVNSTAKITPYLSWPTPAPITQGTPLSATQLNAAAKFAGTFVYTPPTGTVLPAGTHTLSVKFTPADTTLYNTVAAYRSLVVNATTKITQ